MELADYYRLLGLRTGASYEEIKASYRRLARRYHPDANPTNQQQAQERFIQLTEAYKALSNLVPPKPVEPAAPAQEAPKAARTRETARRSGPDLRPPIKVTVTKTASKSAQSPQIQFQNLSAAEQQLKRQSYEQLQQLLKQQRFPRAVALIEGLAQRLPHDGEVRQWQAITYQRFGRYLIGNRQSEKARVYLKKALRTDPHNKSLWYEVERDFRRIEQIGIY
jgi:curved DNA-binding protein CbpA